MSDLGRLQRQVERAVRQVQELAAPARALQETLRVLNRLTVPQVRLPELNLTARLAEAISPHSLVAAQQRMMASQVAIRQLTANFARLQERITLAFEPLSQHMQEIGSLLLGEQLEAVTGGIRQVLENRILFRRVRLAEYRGVPRAINLATQTLQASLRITLRIDDELVRAPFSLVGAMGVIGAGAAEVGRAEDMRPALAPWEVGPRRLREALYEYLEEIHPALADKARGAWDAVHRGGTDSFSQAAHSVQELLDHVLRKEAPEADALQWCERNYPKGIEEEKLTRAGRVRYICARKGRDPRPADSLARTVGIVSGFAQGAKHSLDFPEGDRIPAIILVVEGLLGYLIL